MTREMDSTCRAMLAHISAYLDGELDAVECSAIDRHCRGCPRCTSIVAGLRRTIGLCRDAGKAPLPDPIRKRARQSIRRLLAAKTIGQPRITRPLGRGRRVARPPR